MSRKNFLPNYGLFDERRFFGAGDRAEAVDSTLGVRLGISICEDFWHLPTPYLLALDGAQLLVNISSSPGRDVAAVVEGGLGTADAWRPLLRTYAMLTTSFVIYVNRVGVEESVTFWGGSEVIDPSGHSLLRAPLHEDGLFIVDIDTDDLRRERLALPVLRDERPELVLRQLERLVRRRAGCRRWPGRMTETIKPPSTADLPYELPAELLIDTAMARRIIGQFITGPPEDDRLRACRSGPVRWH